MVDELSMVVTPNSTEIPISEITSISSSSSTETMVEDWVHRIKLVGQDWSHG